MKKKINTLQVSTETYASMKKITLRSENIIFFLL